MGIDNTFVSAIADLLINLSAGWLGAGFILPITVSQRKMVALTLNLGFGILSLIIAVLLRKAIEL